ncbi:Kelch repeat-containing protein [Corallococcus macrosporus]|uniref:Kelch repeat-containing protein n=1 Tax=Corallococcus macrosporus TaxID=35 RepID=UPI001EE65481|nr:kelch repeat-containing protein [Corallococcus macrosporus]
MKRIASFPSLLTLLACAACGPEAVEQAAPSPEVQTAALATPQWLAAAPALTARSDATGQVLVTGGPVGSASTAESELYAPKARGWSATAPLAVDRCLHTATELASGAVLVAGGSNTGMALASVESYNPASKTWSTLAAMNEPRSGHVAVRLPWGHVLVIGGNASTTVTTAELYDPVTNTWTPTGSLLKARSRFNATMLPTGKVVVTGGRDSTFDALTSTEVYNPATGTWFATGSMYTGRADHGAILMPDGRVLVAGGFQTVFPVTKYTSTAELYDPVTGTWTTTSNIEWTGRSDHTLNLLNSGLPIAVGGRFVAGLQFGAFSINGSNLYSPASGTWTYAGSLTTGRYFHESVVLPSGQLLTAGGESRTGGGMPVTTRLASAELYDPATSQWTSTASMLVPRANFTLTPLHTQEVLAVGCGPSGGPSAELYTP